MAVRVDFEKLEFQNLDHLGLVAGLFQKFDLAGLLDKQLPVSQEKGSMVSHGQRAAAMLINGLGFTAKPFIFPAKPTP